MDEEELWMEEQLDSLSMILNGKQKKNLFKGVDIVWQPQGVTVE